MNRCLLVLLLSILVLPCVTANFYIINDTQKEHYALENVLVTGDLEDDELSLFGSGEVISGSDVKVYLFGPSSDFLVSDVVVDGERSTVSFDDKGYYFIAQKGKFDFSAKLSIRTLGQISLYIPGPLNEILFDIENGYTIDHNRYGLYEDTIIIQRTEEVAKRAEGEFHFVFDAQRNNFNYDINFRAFGSDLGRYELPLRNGESVHDVKGALNWRVSGNSLILELEGDSASVSISGTFRNTDLRVPLDEARHHVLVESDPEKKITILTNARVVDLSESPIYSTYSNARAFLASYGEPINVDVRDLKLLPSLSASISSAEQTLSITPSGGVVGHANYRYSNTGVDYIPIEIPGTPLYAATSRRPVKLTQDPQDDQFLLAFPKQDRGTLELIYYETIASLKPISYFEVPLTDVDLPITRQDVSIIVPDDYYVLNIFGAKDGSELPSLRGVILFLVILGALSFFLFRNYVYTLFAVLFFWFLYMFDGNLFFIFAGIAFVLVVKKYFPKTNIRWKVPLLVGGIVIGVIVVLVGLLFFLGSIFSATILSSDEKLGIMDSSVRYDVDYEEADALRKVGYDDAQMSAPMKEGVLPVKLELPQLGKKITVTDHLVTKEKPASLEVLMVAEWLKYLFYILGLISGYFCIMRVRSDWSKIWSAQKQ